MKVWVLFVLALCAASCAVFRTHDVKSVRIEFESVDGYGLNTFAGIYRFGALKDHDTTIVMWLTEDEQRRVRTLADSIRFTSLPDSIAEDDGLNPAPDPPHMHLRIRTEFFDKTVRWHVPEYGNMDTWPRLNALIRTLWNIIESKPEFKSLPRPRGMPL